jgi:long-chain acyl-CoA synthetase
MNIGTLIPRHAQVRPNHTAFIYEDTRLTYAQFAGRVNRCANMLLGMGISKGEKVATILPNSTALVELLWAVAQTGIVIVPLSPMLRGKGLQSLLHDSDAVAVVTTQDMVQHLDPLRDALPNISAERYVLIDSESEGYANYETLTVDASPSSPPYTEIDDKDLYNIIYSSGTTGLPKGIMHDHYVRANYCTGFSASYRITPESVILHTGSLVFNGAFLTFMPAFFQGATYILHPYFDVERMIETVKQEGVTHIMMVPSQIVAMLNSPSFDPSKMQSLEMICTVGAPLHLEHKKALNEALPDIFYELYGLTEGFVTILDKTMYEAKPASVGVPPPFYEMRIVDANGVDVPANEVGEIVGRGPITMPGYYKRPDLTNNAIRDGWLFSGDMGYVDEDGFLYLVDRKKDLIISGGVNVYPRDIEEVIVQHPNVMEVAVFGIPDDRWGETPAAAVILDKKHAISAEDLQAWINDQVEARYQKVSKVVIKDDFPRSVSGKTLKRQMRAEFWEGRDTKI